MSRTELDPYPNVLRSDSVFGFAGSLKTAAEKIPSFEIVWWLFAACIVVGDIGYFIGDAAGPVRYMLAYGGAAGCAWAWLFARSLFRSDSALTKWPLYLLAATVLIEGSWEIAHNAAAAGEMKRLIGNAASFLCISMLALVFVEALAGFTQNLTAAERRFRISFIGFFVLALAVTMLWSLNAPEGTLAAQSQAPARLAFGLIAVVGGRCAVEYRKRVPLTATVRKRKPRLSANDADFAGLAGRIRGALEAEDLFATPKLKVSDLSKALGEPEYKITQCITGAMGYQNFNRLVNAYRIESAKAALKNRENSERQILAIALECGFNSIGPFNRAFKEEVGMTPREYRAQLR